MSEVYRDEPITFRLAQKEIYTPPKYLAMREIAKGGASFHKSEAQIFYEQGKFMEGFEDNFDYHGDFMRYYPTYQDMNNAQLRGYFSWRAKVRSGVVERTPLSFVFVYIYELLNQIGVRTPEEGFYALKNFQAEYRKFSLQIDRYVNLWLQDYVVYHDLDRSLLKDLMAVSASYNAILTLFSRESCGAEEVFAALTCLSSYGIENSRFFKKYPEDVRDAAHEVFAELRFEKHLGGMYVSSYPIFRAAVFYDRLRRKNFVYKASEICQYICKDGSWSCERFFFDKGKKNTIGELLKTIDFVMRRKYKFKSNLKMGNISGELLNVIETVVDKYLERKREAARPQIEIDVSKLHKIRKAALETQGKLLVEEAAEPNLIQREPPLAEFKPENPIGLSRTDYLFLKSLLYGQDALIKQTEPLSVIADRVNEAFFGRFGDNVITEAAGRPELIEDYIAELKCVINCEGEMSAR